MEKIKRRTTKQELLVLLNKDGIFNPGFTFNIHFNNTKIKANSIHRNINQPIDVGYKSDELIFIIDSIDTITYDTFNVSYIEEV